MRQLLTEQDVIRRAATRDLPRSPMQRMVRGLLAVAVVAIIGLVAGAALWTFLVLWLGAS